MLGDITKEIIKDIGISAIEDILLILRQAKKVCCVCFNLSVTI